MELYDGLIHQTYNLTEAFPSVKYSYSEVKCWPEEKDFSLILQRDTALETGLGNRTAANYTCVTTNADLFDRDEIIICGPDIKQLTTENCYTRIAIVVVKKNADTESDTNKLHHMIQDIDFIKYHVFPKGFMIRTSGQSSREQVRISKKAMESGISFEQIGNTFIRHFKENPNVLKVQMIFVTAEGMDYKKLEAAAKSANDIKNSLSELAKGMPIECSSCGIREICNEVEGLRELHFGKSGEKKSRPIKI